MDIVCAVQESFDLGSELAIVQKDFRGAFDRVTHSGLLYKLVDVEVGGAVL